LDRNTHYREVYGTFEEYCKEKWNISRPRAYEFMKAAEVKDNLSAIAHIDNEAQARPLTRIKDPDEQREVYQKAVETAPEGKVTARHIEETVNEYKHTETHIVLLLLVKTFCLSFQANIFKILHGLNIPQHCVTI